MDIKYNDLELVFQSEGAPEGAEIPAEEFSKIMEVYINE